MIIFHTPRANSVSFFNTGDKNLKMSSGSITSYRKSTITNDPGNAWSFTSPASNFPHNSKTFSNKLCDL